MKKALTLLAASARGSPAPSRRSLFARARRTMVTTTRAMASTAAGSSDGSRARAGPPHMTAATTASHQPTDQRAQQQGRGDHAQRIDRDHVAGVDEDERRQVHAVQQHQHEVHGHEHGGEHERATRHAACSAPFANHRGRSPSRERRAELRERREVRVHHAEATIAAIATTRRADAGHRARRGRGAAPRRRPPIAEHADRHHLQGEVAGADRRRSRWRWRAG